MNPLRHYILYGKEEGRIPKLYTFKELDKLNLKHCIRGRKNFYFLINDTNNEIKQHFDENYKNQFNKDKFNNDFDFKKNILIVLENNIIISLSLIKATYVKI